MCSPKEIGGFIDFCKLPHPPAGNEHTYTPDMLAAP